MAMTIYAAIRLASQAHLGQYREDGSPYIEHPLSVLQLLWKCSMDLPIEVYISAILHDVLEDTALSYENLLYAAGPNVAAVVRVLTKDVDYYKLPHHVREKFYLQRLEKISTLYPYTPLLKMADRIHNIQTCDALSFSRRKRMLHETKEIYLPFFTFHLERIPDSLKEPYFYLLQLLKDVMTSQDTNLLTPASSSTHTSPY